MDGHLASMDIEQKPDERGLNRMVRMFVEVIDRRCIPDGLIHPGSGNDWRHVPVVRI